MSDHEQDDDGRNETQRRMDEEGTSDRPVDAEWEEAERSPLESDE
jgi:hypothetical protein